MVSCPQSSTGTLAPGAAATGVPSTSTPVAVPRPSVAWTLLAETAPPKRDTAVSVTCVELHVDVVALEDSKLRTDPDDGYADGPRLEAGVPSAITACPGGIRAAAPAPMQPAGREDSGRGE
jgi:hypothetical protein